MTGHAGRSAGASAGIGCGLAGAEVVRAIGLCCRWRARRSRRRGSAIAVAGRRRRGRPAASGSTCASGSAAARLAGARRRRTTGIAVVGVASSVRRLVALEDRPPALVDGVLVDEVLLVHLVDEPFVGSELARGPVVGSTPVTWLDTADRPLSPLILMPSGMRTTRWSHPVIKPNPIRLIGRCGTPRRASGGYRESHAVLSGRRPRHDLTYSDVFLVPRRSDVTSRLDVVARAGRRHRRHHPDRVGEHELGHRPAARGDARPPRRPRRAAAGHAPAGPRRRDPLGEGRSRSPSTPRSSCAPERHRRRRPCGSSRRRGPRHRLRDADGRRTSAASPAIRLGTALPDARLGDLLHGALTSLDADDVDAARAPPSTCMVAAELDFAPVLRHGRVVGTLSRTSALRSTSTRPALDARRPAAGRRRGRHQRRRRREGEGARRRRASTCSCSTRRTATRRACSARIRTVSGARPRPADRRRQRRHRRGACATSSTRAPTSSRSASGPARCARPA